MGVHGLWRLIEPSGTPVPLETLENKTLAVDISIWLHQAVKGFQDSKGAPLPNAHLLGIFHRLCKLLYYRIRPVFVFDGGVPALKKQTIAKRNQLKTKNFNEANRIQKQLLNTLLKHSAINKVISEKTKATIEHIQKSPIKNRDGDDDLFKLPPAELETALSSSDDDYSSDTTESSSPTRHWDLHTIDEKSTHFKSLPADVRHDILTELKETRKQSSWGRIHELPTHSDDFSIYQMKRLLKRHSVQVSLEETEKEMGGVTLSLGELEALLNDHGVITSNKTIGQRIASDENTRYFLIKDVKKAMEEAMKEQADKEANNKENLKGTEDTQLLAIQEEKTTNSEFEDDLKQAIQLSLLDVPSTSQNIPLGNAQQSTSKDNVVNQSETVKPSENYLENFNDADFQSDSSESSKEEGSSNKILASAKNYMVEYSGLTPNEIAKILGNNSVKSKQTTVRSKECKVALSTEQESVCLNGQNKIEVKEIHDIPNEDNSKTNELIELISESSSDSDFLEIEENSPDDKESNLLEIVVNPVENLDDDLFGDIFDKSQENLTQSDDLMKTTDVINSNEHHVGDSEEIRASAVEQFGENVIAVDCTKNTQTETTVEVNEPQQSLLGEILEPIKNKVGESLGNETEKINLSTKQLEEIKLNLISEEGKLISERSTKERLASNITDQMYKEAQELLELFGVPYIVAPMEAEAQCAFLDEIDLTDGTITDDSDIWLFGGKTVYKNFFNQSKRVMEFQSENIFHSFKLSRYEMILLALLVGSDYTTGIQGIGPVTALEILAAFPSKKISKVIISQDQLTSGLKEFQKWFKQDRISGPKRLTLRNKLKNVTVSDNFPSSQVVQAYLEPTVDSSNEKFSWGRPDVVALIDFAKEKFGWNQKKSDEILKPVMKRLEETQVQSKITNYFKTKHKIGSQDAENKMSKRVKMAVKKIGKDSDSADEDLKVLKQTKTRSKRKVKQIENEINSKIEKEVKSGSKQVKVVPNLHKKDTIPQKQKDKADALRSKMKAIEVFRKSKQGPGYAKKRQKIATVLKEDAELSENSD